MLRVTHDHYLMSTRTTENGTMVREADETVDAAYVRRYVEAGGFFESLGGTEVHRRTRSGALHLTSTSPDGAIVHETVFTPTYPTP